MQLPLALLLLPVVLATPLNPDARSPTSSSSEAASITKRSDSDLISGDANAFPGPELWLSFEDLWLKNEKTIISASGEENAQFIKDAIGTVAEMARTVDKRVILATIMQESSGNVHVQTTSSPGSHVRNPGLMQSHDGAEFDENKPKESILQMIIDGTIGTDKGKGLSQLLEQYNYAGYGEKIIFIALRAYNSGSVKLSDLSDAKGATASYVSDIAKRLTGVLPN